MAAQGARKIHQLSSASVRPVNATQVLDYILHTAIRQSASDVHFGAQHSGAQAARPYLLRLRVHGKLQELPSDILTDHFQEVVTRLKVLSGIDTTSTTVAQDGQMTLTTAEGAYMCRINIIPSLGCEEVAIRISSEGGETAGLETLNLSPHQGRYMQHLLSQKSGMIVLTGPAGSGKTSTIYSMLKHLSGPHIKIATVEDPVEKVLPYVSHMQVGSKTNFASMARAFMRQDADVIFIGEVRDAESADAAVQLAQTGHLVLTTLHTRDALGVVPRLKAMEIHPNFIASALVGSVAQRLVVVLCPDCRQEYQPDQRLLDRIYQRYKMPDQQKFFKTGPGCDKCQSGVVARTPIFEFFVPDAISSELINADVSKAEIFNYVRKQGFTTLGEEALMRVHAGYFDLADVYGYVTASY